MGHRGTWRWVVIAALGSACLPFSLDLDDRPCLDDPCLPEWVCHPETGACVPAITVGCDVAMAICPESTSTGTPCDAFGAFLPCTSAVAYCGLGCRTCRED